MGSLLDEINPLVSGNFGWDPVGNPIPEDYDQSSPMTDLDKFPDPDGLLYITNDASNGSDEVLKVTPVLSP